LRTPELTAVCQIVGHLLVHSDSLKLVQTTHRHAPKDRRVTMAKMIAIWSPPIPPESVVEIVLADIAAVLATNGGREIAHATMRDDPRRASNRSDVRFRHRS
jgi:hypothetical protein